jgi:4-hydroxy-4-methyl-2-oxoglutarate aldolase
MNDLIEAFSTRWPRLRGRCRGQGLRPSRLHGQRIKPRINEKRICGPAVTVLEAATDEFLPPQHALDLIDEAPRGSVIVIAIEGGVADVAVWGGLMTAGAVANEHAGAVLDGAVRDLTEIRRDYGFPVYARARQPRHHPGPLPHGGVPGAGMVGGIMVHPGDIIVGDIDGVVVVPRPRAAEVLASWHRRSTPRTGAGQADHRREVAAQGPGQVWPDLSPGRAPAMPGHPGAR